MKSRNMTEQELIVYRKGIIDGRRQVINVIHKEYVDEYKEEKASTLYRRIYVPMSPYTLTRYFKELKEIKK